MATTKDTAVPVPDAIQTARQKLLEEIRRRLEEDRKKKGKGKYEAPARVGGPTRTNP